MASPGILNSKNCRSRHSNRKGRPASVSRCLSVSGSAKAQALELKQGMYADKATGL